MAVDAQSIARVVDMLSVLYEQEIKELAQTPFASNPTRDLFKVSCEKSVSEEDLNRHVVFLEHALADPSMRVCFFTFRAAMTELDKKFDNKLSVQANPLWHTPWVNREDPTYLGIGTTRRGAWRPGNKKTALSRPISVGVRLCNDCSR